MERHMIEPDVVSNDDDSNETQKPKKKTRLGERFRGFLPVVVDLETGGFNAETDALLESRYGDIGYGSRRYDFHS